MQIKSFLLIILFLSMLLVSSLTMQAQQRSINRLQSSLTLLSASSKTPLNMNQCYSTHYSGDGKKLRNGGLLLVIAGVATVVGGFVLVKDANGVTSYTSQTTNGNTTTTGSFSGAMGALAVAGGTLGVLGGSVMAIVGQCHLSKSRKGAAFSFSPTGISAMYRF